MATTHDLRRRVLRARSAFPQASQRVLANLCGVNRWEVEQILRGAGMLTKATVDGTRSDGAIVPGVAPQSDRVYDAIMRLDVGQPEPDDETIAQDGIYSMAALLRSIRTNREAGTRVVGGVVKQKQRYGVAAERGQWLCEQVAYAAREARR